MKKTNRSKAILFLIFSLMLLTSGTIDVNNLLNYSNQTVPSYIIKDNTPLNNTITDETATLGRVLFYDKNLSANNKIACASCHKQEFAFGDTATVSEGLNGGLTMRHAPRLINMRFAEDSTAFWDRRASSIEMQTTMPIQDHVEMGFSGAQGDPDFDSLINKLAIIPYYDTLFTLAYGNDSITEEKIQKALAQFVRSIQSFDSKYDSGRALVTSELDSFPNFTVSENLGKTLFNTHALIGGASCYLCHVPPEFDIKRTSKNIGLLSVAGDSTAVDSTNERSPTIRDVYNPNGEINGPFMHDGSHETMEEVLEFYDSIPADDATNGNFDPLLGIPPYKLNLTATKTQALIDFMKTLSGNAVYTDVRWSDPFDECGNPLLGICITDNLESSISNSIKLFPNPSSDWIIFDKSINSNSLKEVEVYSISGNFVLRKNVLPSENSLNIQDLDSGTYLIKVHVDGRVFSSKIVKQ